MEIKSSKLILNDIKALVTLPQDLTVTASPTFAAMTLTGLTASRLVSSEGGGLVSIASDITEGELEELSDGSETSLHSHAAGSAGNCSMITGVYTGDGTSPREIDVGINLASKQNQYLIIKSEGTEEGLHRIEYEQGSAAMRYGAAVDYDNSILSFSANGFTIDHFARVNGNGVVFRYIVFYSD